MWQVFGGWTVPYFLVFPMLTSTAASVVGFDLKSSFMTPFTREFYEYLTAKLISPHHHYFFFNCYLRVCTQNYFKRQLSLRLGFHSLQQQQVTEKMSNHLLFLGSGINCFADIDALNWAEMLTRPDKEASHLQGVSFCIVKTDRLRSSIVLTKCLFTS